MELSLFDLHCDTAFEMLRKHVPLSGNGLALSLESTAKFKQYIQIFSYENDCNAFFFLLIDEIVYRIR